MAESMEGIIFINAKIMAGNKYRTACAKGNICLLYTSRAEDGRSIHHVDISMFINDLPNKKDTKHFYTEDASGSTSQAANVVEAIESGTSLLLIDEDTSASNFMVRDLLMESVVSRSCEPITPLIHRIRKLYEDWGISSILVAGSSGAFFEKADCIIQMDRYKPLEITAFAKEQARRFSRASTLMPDIPDTDGCTPVSYTHLDVYKRQH